MSAKIGETLKGLAAPPLLPDEVARLPYLPATEEMPEQTAAALAERRLYMAGVAPKANRVDQGAAGDPPDVTEYLLPQGALLGRPGRTAERIDPPRSARDEGQAAATEPMRPAWMPQAAQPPLAGQRTARSPLRRVGGGQLEPYYGVFGPDDRAVYYPNTYPWICVGRIFTWTNWAGGGSWDWWGAGVLVGSRHVLTAGHVCPWGSSSWAMRFVPGYWDGAPTSGAGAESYASDFRGWNTNDTVAARDMAVLRLFEPVGSSLGWVGTRTYDSAWEGGAYWTLAGYPAAIAGGERPSYQSSIAVLDDDNDGDAKELEHQGDSTGGDSGGPFFGWWNNQPYAIGTTSGGERISGTLFGLGDEDNNIEAGGKAMVDLVQWGLSNWT
jgi:V8-like Glu-specific endopeptidase